MWILGLDFLFNLIFYETSLVDFPSPKTPVLVFSELLENLAFGVRVKKERGSTGTRTHAGRLDVEKRYPLDQRDTWRRVWISMLKNEKVKQDTDSSKQLWLHVQSLIVFSRTSGGRIVLKPKKLFKLGSYRIFILYSNEKISKTAPRNRISSFFKVSRVSREPKIQNSLKLTKTLSNSLITSKKTFPTQSGTLQKYRCSLSLNPPILVNSFGVSY